MDPNTIAQEVRSRFDHATAKRLTKEKYEARLVFAYNGGMWRASPEMITFLSLYGEEEVVIPDLYETPVKVYASLLCFIMKERWQEQMNAWLVEHEELQKQR